MSATDELIRAYAHFTLTPDKAGDFDINARKASKTALKRRRVLPSVCHGKETRTSPGSNHAVCAALRAGKIITAGEGKTDYEAAYSRVYYSDYAKSSDKRTLLMHLLARAYRRTKDLEMMAAGHDVFRCYAAAQSAPNDLCISHSDLFYIVSTEIARLHHSTAMRVSKALRAMRSDIDT